MKCVKSTLLFLVSLLAVSMVFNRYIADISAFYYATISPPVAYIQLIPGETISHQVSITNKTPHLQTYEVSAVDFISDGSTGTPILSSEFSFPYITNQRTTFSEITVNSQQTKRISIDIDVPVNATPKEYAFSVLFSQKNTSIKTDSSQTQITAAIASNVVVSILPEKNSTAYSSIKKITTRKIIDSFESIVLKNILAENIFPHAAPIEGNIIITSMLGRSVASFAIHPDIILGKTTRLVRFAGNDVLTPKQHAEYHNIFLFGGYQVSHVSTQTGKITPLTTVYALPISLLFFLILILTGYIYLRRYLNKKSKLSPRKINKNR